MCRKTVLFLILFAPLFSLAQGSGSFERWQSVSLADNKIGHRWLNIEYRERQVVSHQVLEIETKVPGEPVRKSTITLEYIETLSGEPVAINKKVESESANYLMQARVAGAVLKVKLKSGGKVKSERFAIPDNFIMPRGLQKRLLAHKGNDKQLEYSNWSFSKMGFEKNHITWREERLTGYSSVHWRIDKRKENILEPTVLYADEQFTVLREVSRVTGKDFVIETCDKACALSAAIPLKNVYSQLVRSPYRIPDAVLKRRIRYTLRSDYPLSLPQTFEQKVRVTPEGVQVEVCSDCGAESAPAPLELENALQNSFWLDYTDAALQKQLGKLFSDPLPPAEKVMTRLETFVSRHMKKGPVNYSGYAPASEAFKSRSGDCTEQALLLAAMGRAAGVPTRVAVGLAYSNERFYGRSHVFVPHAWVQAWVGDKWKSFDSGMEGFTSGHIALGLSDGEQGKYMEIMQQLHALEISSAAQLKTKK
ncbi:Transglutaminase-like enzymes, putative cysteine proteases [Alteromonadaceae bacterium Bs31]|nr:Transglutaminase-like enzymes, putative cysteine proteases [Alteromonadaceae bacterium Bs31]